MRNKLASLKRQRNPMPSFVRDALNERGLMAAYRARPAYQQNDNLNWSNQVQQEETKQKRLRQMLDELEASGIYMKMKHAASSANRG